MALNTQKIPIAGALISGGIILGKALNSIKNDIYTIQV